MNPNLVEEITSPDLTPLETLEPSDFRRAMTAEHAAQLADMMINVVDHGTGSNAQIPGVAVGGKTGTAQTRPDRPSIAWFIAFAPGPAPEVAVAVAVENGPPGEVSGNQLAAPVARAVIQAVLSQ